MSERLPIEDFDGYSFTAKSLTWGEAIDHDAKLKEASGLAEMISLRINELVEAVYAPGGSKVSDLRSLPNDLIGSLAIAASDTLVPKALRRGEATEKKED